MLKIDTSHWAQCAKNTKQGARTLDDTLAFLKSAEARQEWPFLFVSEEKEDLQILSDSLKHFQDFDDVLMVGTGGSSLGGQMIYEISSQHKPKLHFIDNVDPHTFTQKIDRLDLKKTGAVVISKSGTTSETLCQFMCLLTRYEKCVNDLSKNFLIITEPGTRPMRVLAERYNLPCFDHDPKIGGRFSVLSNVGMSAGLLAGVDVQAVRKGATQVLEQALTEKNILEIPAVKSALLNHALHEAGHTISVMMPYSDRLRFFTKWFVQLWAESLGKQNIGNTPIHALGTVDQHSQLQLFLDGPRDKAFTIITTDTFDRGEQIAPQFNTIEGLGYFEDTSMGDLFYAHQEATVATLKHNDCPTRSLHIGTLNEESLGALTMTFMLETIFMAALMGINAFDQPAVEEGKVRMKEFMNRLKNDNQTAFA